MFDEGGCCTEADAAVLVRVVFGVVWCWRLWAVHWRVSRRSMSSSLCLGPSVVVLGLWFLMLLLDGRLLFRLRSMLVIISRDQSLDFLTLQLMLVVRRVLLVGFSFKLPSCVG